MQKIKLALLSGGDSSEREVSINSGMQVYEALNKEKYDIIKYDPKTDLNKIIEDAPNIDVALLILHGPNGEDGTVQGLLELLKIPYQGAGVLGSALAMNKLAAKKMYEHAGIKIPPYIPLSKDQFINSRKSQDSSYSKASPCFKDVACKIDNLQIDSWITKLGLPIVVKPASAGSSVGMSIVKNREDVVQAIEKAFQFDKNLLLESYIKGIELTCGVLGNRELEALPVIEIIPGKEYEFFDYNAKYLKGASEEICPARIEDKVRIRVQEYAVAAHKALFLKGYSRSDMILSDGEIYLLETNTIPGMTATSLFPQSAKVAGYSFAQVLDKLIELAMES